MSGPAGWHQENWANGMFVKDNKFPVFCCSAGFERGKGLAGSS